MRKNSGWIVMFSDGWYVGNAGYAPTRYPEKAHKWRYKKDAEAAAKEFRQTVLGAVEVVRRAYQ